MKDPKDPMNPHYDPLFFVIFLVLFLTMIFLGACSTFSDHDAKLRKKFIDDAYVRCVSEGGFPYQEQLFFGNYVGCKKHHNIVFRVQVP